MSGGSAGANPYYSPARPTKPIRAKPKKVIVHASGRRSYVYTCARCGRDFEKNRRSQYQTTYCGEICRRRALGELGSSRKGQERTDEDKQKMSKGQKEAWSDPTKRAERMKKMAGAKRRRGPDKEKRPSRVKSYTYSCTGCGKNFTTHRKRTGEKKFYNAECRNKWQTRQRTGKEAECENPLCDKKFYLSPSKTDRKYCSMKCAKTDIGYWDRVAETRRERYGRDWKWTGWHDVRPDDSEWRPIAERVRAKDGQQCQSCRKMWQKGRSRFPVHHILPRKKGGPDEDWNLITLCQSCHRKTDAKGGPVRYPKDDQTALSDFL